MKKMFLILSSLIFLLGIISNVYSAQSVNNSVGSTLLDSSYNKKLEFLDKPVIVPDKLQFLSRVIFGLNNNEEVSLSIFIVLLVLLAIMFSIINMAVSLMPIFQSKPIQYVVSAAVTLLIGISGAMRDISIFLFDASSHIKLISNSSIFGMVLSIIVLVVVFVLVQYAVNYAKKQYKIAEAEKSAIDLVKIAVKDPFGTYH